MEQVFKVFVIYSSLKVKITNRMKMLLGDHDKSNLTILRNLTLLEMHLGSLYHSLRGYHLEDTY